MPYTGTIVSHDPSLHTGLVLPDGVPKAVGFTEGDVINWEGTTALYGQRVSFDVIQTPNGYAAIQMILLRATPRPSFNLRGNNWPAAIVGPIMVAITTYIASLLVPFPPVFAYVIAVNFITLLMFVLVAISPSTGRSNPAEASLTLLALCGGAPTLLVCMIMIHSRLRSEGMMALLLAFVVMQVILAQRYSPEILNWREWWDFYLAFQGAFRHSP
jgi:hypothetical protein